MKNYVLGNVVPVSFLYVIITKRNKYYQNKENKTERSEQILQTSNQYLETDASFPGDWLAPSSCFLR